MGFDRCAVLGVGAGLLVVAAAAGGRRVLRGPYAPPGTWPAGRLTTPGTGLGTTAFGSATATYEVGTGQRRTDDRKSGRAGTFAVSRAAHRLWWADGPFLAAATGRLDWRDRQGHFVGTRHLETVFTDQDWTGLERISATAVRLTGLLRPQIGSSGRRPDPLPWTVTLSGEDDRLLVEVGCLGADLLVLRSGLGRDEAVHGLGEQFCDFDLRGRFVPLLTREQGVGRGRQPITVLAEWDSGAGGSPTTTYAPMPSLVTEDLRGLRWDNDEVAEVDLRGGRLDVGVWADRIDAAWRDAPTPADLVAGPNPAIPGWAFGGAIVGLQGGTEAVRADLAALDRARLGGVWLQDWVGPRTTGFGRRLWWTWQLDERHYPGWSRLVDDLTARDIRVLTYINPFVVDPGEKPGGVRRDLYREALDAGFLVGHPDGGPYLLDQGGFSAALLDLTRPEAVDWYAEVIAAMPATGGWMADFGEGLPFDAVLADGDPAVEHNRWPARWRRLNERVAGPDDLVFFRSAWRGNDAAGADTPAPFGIQWAGDQLVTWDRHDGMASALLGMLHGAVSGIPVNHTDAGGYTGLPQPIIGVHRDTELLQRWLEWSVWTPILRTHEGNRPGEFAQVYDRAVADTFARHSAVFEVLAAYRQATLAAPLPPIRPVWLEAPGSAAARRDDAYFFGTSFLVVPVFRAGVRDREVTLPPGSWRLVWTDQSYAGDRVVRVPAPLGRTPVFHRDDDAGAAAIAARARAIWG